MRVLRIWTGGSKDRTPRKPSSGKPRLVQRGFRFLAHGSRSVRPTGDTFRWFGKYKTASWGAEGPRYGSIMDLFKLLASAIRRIVRFPLFQFAVVVAIVLFLQAADEHSLFGWIFDELDQVVAATVSLCSNLFSVKSFTRSRPYPLFDGGLRLRCSRNRLVCPSRGSARPD